MGWIHSTRSIYIYHKTWTACQSNPIILTRMLYVSTALYPTTFLVLPRFIERLTAVWGTMSFYTTPTKCSDVEGKVGGYEGRIFQKWISKIII